MKNRMFSLLMVLVSGMIHAQNTGSVKKNQFKVNLLLPGIAYEYGFDNKNTIYSELSTGIGYRVNGFGKNWSLYPTLNSQLRHYYNLDSRVSNNKVIAKNSGGYWGLDMKYYFKSITSNPLEQSNSAFMIAPVWGFQRTYKGNFNLGLSLGYGYLISNNSGFAPTLNFSLGWVFGK